MKPILFNTEMVRAILYGRKTCTRRVIKPQPLDKPMSFHDEEDGFCIVCHVDNEESLNEILPPYQPGDILYVRETWLRLESCVGCMCDNEPDEQDGCYLYRATHGDAEGLRWRPSIHMPKEAARLFLRVTAVRVERLQDITNEQARSEGCDGRCNCPSSGAPGSLSCVTMDFSIEKFETVWDSTIPRHPNKFKRYPYYWDDNPWVWVIDFERCEKPEAHCDG